MSKSSKGDCIVFYSSKNNFENGKPLQKFTAIGQVVDEEKNLINLMLTKILNHTDET